VTFYKNITVLIFLLNLGLPPVHNWLIQILKELKVKLIFFILTIHKLLPLFLISSIIIFRTAIILLASTVIFRLILIVSRTTLIDTLLVSSIINRVWILLSIQVQYAITLFYWIVYSLILTTIIRLRNLIIIRNVQQSKIIFLFWLLRSGIPPFTLFWIKVTIIINLKQMTLTIWTIIILMIILIVAYYRIIRLMKFSSNKSGNNTIALLLRSLTTISY